METGTYISGAAHGLMLGWVMLGGVLFRDPEPAAPPVTQVTTISEAELAALSASTPVPDAQSGPAEPVPVVQPAPPDQSGRSALLAPGADTPAPTPTPEPPAPELSAPDPSLPDQPVPDTPPDLLPDLLGAVPEGPLGPPSETPPDAAPPKPPVPRPAPRIAETPQPPSPEDAHDDTLRQSATAPAPGPDPAVPVEQTTAPPQAADRIVTEAEAEPASAAPARSPLPLRRPARPAPTPAVAEAPGAGTAQASPAASADPLADAIAAAVAQAASEPAAPLASTLPSGPPLTGGEKDALRVSVQRCWNVGSLSSEALRVTVTVAVDMSEDGRPDARSIRMLASSGGSQSAAKQAFEAARRAIIRCGARGFALPVEKYSHWREIEMIFNPEKMRIK